MDEALEISFEQQSSFLPLLSASKNPQTIYLSSPPDESSDGEVFRRIRETAISGKSKSTTWNEWGVDEIGDVSDRDRWAQVIPSLGYLIKESTVEGELEQMPPDKFARERLGWWSGTSANAVIDQAEWMKCATDDRPTEGLFSYAVKFSADGAIGTVSTAVKGQDGNVTVGVAACFDMSDGLTQFVDLLVPLKHKAAVVVIDGMANAQPLVDELIRSGFSRKAICKPRGWEVAAACSGLLNAVHEQKVRHLNQSDLNDSALKAKKRPVGSGGGWSFADNDCDSTRIESCALAHWGALNTKRNPNRKQRIG